MDEKKIEEAANSSAEQNRWEVAISDDEVRTLCKKVFKEGANWAIQEFLKSLWHDIRQERIPKKGFFLIEMAIEGRIFYVSKRLPAEESNLSSYLRQGCARRWSNLEDLLKHEEGGEK